MNIKKWLVTTDHKDIGKMYIAFTIIAAILGTLLSLVIRLQLHAPAGTIIKNYQYYNVIVSSHGLIMIFFVTMPALIGGFGNYFVPIMIKAPDMAFPD